MAHKKVIRRRLEVIRSQKITVPKSSKAVRIDIRNSQPDLWLEYQHTDEPAEERIIELYSAEEKVSVNQRNLLFIDSFVISDPDFTADNMIFNCFEYRPDCSNSAEPCQNHIEEHLEHSL